MRKLAALVKKDILTEWRDKSLFLLVIVLTFLFFFIFSLALDESIGGEEGILWVVFLILVSLMTQKQLSREEYNQNWDGLSLAPIDPGLIFIGKWIVYMLFLLASDIVLIPLYLVFFDVTLARPIFFIAMVLIGQAGIVSVSVFMAIITMGHRLKEFLTILLQAPLLLPLLIGEIELTKYVFWGGSDFPLLWLMLILGFTILFFTLPALLLSLIKEV